MPKLATRQPAEVPAVSVALSDLLKDLRPGWDAARVSAWQHRLRAPDPIADERPLVH